MAFGLWPGLAGQGKGLPTYVGCRMVVICINEVTPKSICQLAAKGATEQQLILRPPSCLRTRESAILWETMMHLACSPLATSTYSHHYYTLS